MGTITIRVLEGLERGRVYRDLSSPVTVGREDENVVQLNDERISRFHCKLQQNNNQCVLTDLASTNGTRVNGRVVQMHVLQPGDLITIGRCVLLFGETLPPSASDRVSSEGAPETRIGLPPDDYQSDLDFAVASEVGVAPQKLFPKGCPPIPKPGGALERAQWSDVLAWIHDEISHVLTRSREVLDPGEGARVMQLPWPDRQRLVELELAMARALLQLGDPDHTP